MKLLLITSFASLLCLATLQGHHSYGMFYHLDQQVTLKGQVTQVAFQNPHVRLTIETPQSGIWEAEWTSVESLQRQGVTPTAIHTGDFLEIDGSPARDSNRRVVSALREIRRPADSWRWVRR
jgi:hypothetical protein